MTDEQEVAAIPLVEERVFITKREVETGRLRVHVSVQERQESLPVELSRDDIEVERVPINKALTQLPSVRLEGSTTIIPVVEEVAVIEKRLVLVEEIHIRRKSTVETQNIPIVLRSEQANVEKTGPKNGTEETSQVSGPKA